MTKSKTEETAKREPARLKTAESQGLSAMERCQAVLSVWTERRRSAEVCRELKVAGGVLSHWQQLALEGMLQALEPRTNLAQGAALRPRLLYILEKQKRRLLRPRTLKGRLEKRLAGLMPQPSPMPPAKTDKP